MMETTHEPVLPVQSPDVAPMTEDTVLVVQDVGKTYRIYERPQDRLKQYLRGGSKQYYREFQALQGVSMELKRGEFYGIVGRNGSGKSTLLQVVAGTLSPSMGRVHVKGRIAALLELGSGFNPEFTGRDNVFLSGSILGMTREEIENQCEAIIAFADIGDFIDQPVKTYSTGMLVRLAFSVQIMLSPDLLIVDEALAVGDASFQRRCYRRLEDLKEKGIGLLFVSHSIDLVRSICDRAIYLERGVVKAQGDVTTVCDRYLNDLLEEQVGEREREKKASAAAPGTGTAGAEEPAVKPSESYNLLLDEYPNAKKSDGDYRIQGNGGVLLKRAELSRMNAEHKTLYEGDRIRLQVEFQFNVKLRNFLLGVLIRDRVGTDIFGFSAEGDTLGIPRNIEPGDHLRAEIEIACDLRADTYFLTLGTQAEGFTDVLFYGHDILQLTVALPPNTNPRLVGGICRLSHSITGTLERSMNEQQSA